jgi:hypothetical protein
MICGGSFADKDSIMKMNEGELSRLYQEQTAPTGGNRGTCISKEVLAQAAAGQLSRSERERIADHLAVCSECALEYRVARSLRSWSEDASRELPRTGDRKSWFSYIWQPAPILSAVAASLLVVSMVLGAWVFSLQREARSLRSGQIAERNRRLEETRREKQNAGQLSELRQEVAELSRPQLNVPIVDLDPRDSTRGAAAQGPRIISIPATANVFTLILNVEGQPSFSDYSLEIADSSGTVIWAGGGLQKSPSDTFTVAIPRRLLYAGRYQIKLYGARGDRKELIEDYRAVIQYR